MNEQDAVAAIGQAIEYVLLMRKMSGEDNGELDLAGELEKALEFIQSHKVDKDHGG